MAEFTAGGSAGGGADRAARFERTRTARKGLEKLGWPVVMALIAVGLSSVVSRALFLGESLLQPVADPAQTFNPFDIRYYELWLATLLHLVPALVIVALGPLQFVRAIRRRWPALHRWSGRVFIGAGTLGAATGFFIGAFHPFMGAGGAGFNESMATVVFAGYILFCLFRAYASARQRRFGAHREWMIRSWALMIAIATERILLGLLMATTDIGLATVFGTTFWMAGAINIAVSEMWISLTRTPGNDARHWKDLDARPLARAPRLEHGPDTYPRSST